jgi:TorA maturation chaperone TorD
VDFRKRSPCCRLTHDAVTQMAAALAALADTTAKEAAARCTDDLAADYAGIYLTHAMRAAPYESVWRDEDQLMMQAPTFAVREFYTRHGVVVQNWRHQPDDHLSHELRFVALLLERGERREAARFLRTHLLVWLPMFTEKVAQRAETRFYADLATLTLACVQSCVAIACPALRLSHRFLPHPHRPARPAAALARPCQAMGAQTHGQHRRTRP